MDNAEPRCQSCGMPLSPENYGTNASGTENLEYCSMCFQKGGFTDPDLALPLMIQMTTIRMQHELGMPDDEARDTASTIIPQLKRWRNSSL